DGGRVVVGARDVPTAGARGELVLAAGPQEVLLRRAGGVLAPREGGDDGLDRAVGARCPGDGRLAIERREGHREQDGLRRRALDGGGRGAVRDRDGAG